MVSNWRADLHIHSFCSDGSDSPSQLLHCAKAAGLSGLSITDHDTLQAYTPALFSLAEELGLELLIGAEISSELGGQTVHILGYGIRNSLQPFLDQVVHKREERNRKILEKLRQLGIAIDMEELQLSGPMQIIGRPHIAAILVKRNIVSSIREAFERYLQDSAISYTVGGKFSPLEVIEAIHQANGKAVLAHPHLIKKGRCLRSLLNLPFDGLECYYGTLPKQQEGPWVKIANKRGWLATGGSDYHGPLRPFNPIGCSWVSEEIFRNLSGKH